MKNGIAAGKEVAMEPTESICRIFNDKWALVTAGTAESFNTMTVSWGSFGCIWMSDEGRDGAKSIISIYVKPARFTHSFLMQNELFTVSFFDKKYRSDLSVLGTLSGRDTDKLAKTKLTPVPFGNGIGFEEAEKTFLCKKVYWQDFDKEHMPPDVIEKYYTSELPHTMFIGEIIEEK